jgi:hypothetical protein
MCFGAGIVKRLHLTLQSLRRTMVECHIGKSHHRETLSKEESSQCDLKNQRRNQDDRILRSGE